MRLAHLPIALGGEGNGRVVERGQGRGFHRVTGRRRGGGGECGHRMPGYMFRRPASSGAPAEAVPPVVGAPRIEVLATVSG
ncbi:Hypothetical protein AA314_05918 [Archangium gephyra]|uniref:Uncharacterized protein n=1 Tax=Archangium gephyra TaxID=48 RepID=A0AAC8TFM1_9BACT|nr:Hypothetical protein AA314_05918 [Archangium gephyra]